MQRGDFYGIDKEAIKRYIIRSMNDYRDIFDDLGLNGRLFYPSMRVNKHNYAELLDWFNQLMNDVIIPYAKLYRFGGKSYYDRMRRTMSRDELLEFPEFVELDKRAKMFHKAWPKRPTAIRIGRLQCPKCGNYYIVKCEVCHGDEEANQSSGDRD